MLMSILVAQTREFLFNGEITLENYLAYVMRPDSTRYDLVFGIGVNPYNAFYDMKAIKLLFNNECRNTLAGKWFQEYILSLDGRYDSSDDEEEFCECSREIGQIISTHNGHYQVLLAVHNNTDCMHVHFIVNTIDYSTGKRLRSSYENLYELKEKINSILRMHEYTEIKHYSAQ